MVNSKQTVILLPNNLQDMFHKDVSVSEMQNNIKSLTKIFDTHRIDLSVPNTKLSIADRLYLVAQFTSNRNLVEAALAENANENAVSEGNETAVLNAVRAIQLIKLPHRDNV